MTYPNRIVCLAAETPEILWRLGALDKVVGISAFTTRPPEALSIPRVGGFQFSSTKRILEQQPDLVILTSDVQQWIADELQTAGVPVLHLNPHRLEDMLDSVQVIGDAIGKAEQAGRLVADLRGEVQEIQELVAVIAHGRGLAGANRRPRVYFEEWMDPLICGIGWVSDLIELAGGEDVFREKSVNGPSAASRVVSTEDIVHAAPDVILASWCGEPFVVSQLCDRPGFSSIPAVQEGRVHEVSGEVLQCGPMLLDSLRAMVKLIHGFDALPDTLS